MKAVTRCEQVSWRHTENRGYLRDGCVFGMFPHNFIDQCTFCVYLVFLVGKLHIVMWNLCSAPFPNVSVLWNKIVFQNKHHSLETLYLKMSPLKNKVDCRFMADIFLSKGEYSKPVFHSWQSGAVGKSFELAQTKWKRYMRII